MQISPENVATLIVIISVIFLIAPLFLVSYVNLYNQRKKKHQEEKEQLKRDFDLEMLRVQMEVKEETLKTLGAELHDNIGQILSLTTITLTSINLEDAASSTRKLTSATELTRRAIREIRDLSQLLNGENLLKRGLVAAIELELDWLSRLERYTLTFNKKEFNPASSHNNKDVIVFRLFQELISNIIRHAHATQITILLESHTNTLQLTVKDNGVGFTKNKPQKTGMGLYTIEKRAGMIQGTVQFDTAPGQGTSVKIEVPYP
ncbi:sensor histidine kinase [Xanthocytophaga agilis]|uniref:Oxygen sensor histidine kinase NreB n=1 Tax=Xanthocytophaga agilis TaxID=3048010 RepID=A0AAE3UG17_9BACT|nr:ATP-binding protein [Xanthocytophaga agilis]MDJ1502876.1 ATP-binding protein [Xanthocytophaga agilis]